jgi:hypothetical protein
MKQGLLLGMAIALALSLPAMGATSVSTAADSIIIDNVTVAAGQSQVLVPVYFVTFGDVSHYNMPLKIESSGGIHLQGFVVDQSLEGWDDNWQGINTDGSQALNMGFADLGGESNPALNTAGQRVEALRLAFSIDENAPVSVAYIRARVDNRTGSVIFGYADGITGVAPVVREGSVTLQPTLIADQTPMPTEVALKQNYPNPFNPTTEIEFALPQAGPVKLNVFNVLGQQVRSLLSGQQAAGFHKVIWDGRDNSNTEVPSGTYFYKLEADNFSQTMKMVFLK